MRYFRGKIFSSYVLLVTSKRFFLTANAFTNQLHQVLSRMIILPSTQKLSSSKLPVTTSANSPYKKSIDRSYQTSETNLIQLDEDRRTIALHLFSCVATAFSLIKYENYDCANLKPQQASLKKNSVRGLGYGEINRKEGKKDTDVGEGEESLWDVPSYNEIMLKHRTKTVPQWRAEERSQTSNYNMNNFDPASSKRKIQESMKYLEKSLYAILELKKLASDYGWDEMRIILNSPDLNENLQIACSVLRVELDYLQKKTSNLDENNPSNVIGFVWGSCAWRHCGALADIEEALAELKNSLGLFEPFECLFTIDIAERALRDIITVIPAEYKLTELPSYIAYVPQSGDYNDGYIGNEDKVTETISSLDSDFINALNSLRNNFLDD